MSGYVRLLIDLAAIAENYRYLRDNAAGAECAAVVKADAYGLGAEAVTQKLLGEGCKTFFVATLHEAISLQPIIANSGSVLYVLNGFSPSEAVSIPNQFIRPVVNTIADLNCWRLSSPNAKFAVHIDTGFNRLGLSKADDEELMRFLSDKNNTNCDFVMTHLACSDVRDDKMNSIQFERFVVRTKGMENCARSFANSAATLSDQRYHFDLVRPGLALYGEQPLHGERHALKPVLRLEAPILQVRDIRKGEAIGYNATYVAEQDIRVAVIGAGYADGVPRALSNCGKVYWGEHPLTMVGRVSMDSLVVDCGLHDTIEEGGYVELISALQSASQFGEAASLSAYEVLTRLAPRSKRTYV